MPFFDVNLYAGLPKNHVPGAVESGELLLKKLDECGIDKCVAWHIDQYDYAPSEGNNLAAKISGENEKIFGCWTILPPQTEETAAGNDFFASMKQNRIAALRAFPAHHRFLLDRIVFGNFLGEVEQRKIPLILSLEKGNSWQGVYSLMKDFPALTCILCDTGIWGAGRYIWPLLEKYENIYVETSLLALGYGQMEATAGKYGAHRIIFGSGFPERYPEAAICEVLHARISSSDREKIAFRNLEQIISGEKF